MQKPIVTIHDANSNTSIQREMTDEEFAQYQIDEKASKALYDKIAESKMNYESALSKLISLGLTEQEALAVIGRPI